MTLREKVINTEFGFDAQHPYAQVGLHITRAEHDRFLLALDHLEAVEWIEANNVPILNDTSPRAQAGKRWWCASPKHEVEGATLPLAVSNLRAAMKEGT